MNNLYGKACKVERRALFFFFWLPFKRYTCLRRILFSFFPFFFFWVPPAFSQHRIADASFPNFLCYGLRFGTMVIGGFLRNRQIYMIPTSSILHLSVHFIYGVHEVRFTYGVAYLMAFGSLFFLVPDQSVHPFPLCIWI
jgi:hypothetical protein